MLTKDVDSSFELHQFSVSIKPNMSLQGLGKGHSKGHGQLGPAKMLKCVITEDCQVIT